MLLRRVFNPLLDEQFMALTWKTPAAYNATPLLPWHEHTIWEPRAGYTYDVSGF